MTTEGNRAGAMALLAERLGRFESLSEEAVRAVGQLAHSVTRVSRHRDAISKGETPSYLYLMLDGWAGRYSLRADGSRRITGFLLRGDFCGIHAVCHAPMDHSIVALTDCTLAKIDLAEMEAVIARHPALGRALWQAKLVDEAILRMWLLNSADAFCTLAHLFCELDARLHPHAPDDQRSFDLPITQEHIGDALGMTGVHINRTMRQLREAGLVSVFQGKVSVPSISALRRAAYFDSRYLTLESADRSAGLR